MQGGGHLADDLDADEQREYEQCDGNDDVHGLFLAFCGGTSGYDEGVVKFLVQVDAQTPVMHEVGEHVAHVAGEQVQTVVPLIENSGKGLFYKKCRTFLDAIANGDPAPIPSSQILYNQAIIDGINKSAACGHEVEIKIAEI